MKELVKKELVVSWLVIWFFEIFENHDEYIPKLGLWLFRSMVMNPKNQLDDSWGYVPISNNQPPLVVTEVINWCVLININFLSKQKENYPI
jgi:hypothetical protein